MNFDANSLLASLLVSSIGFVLFVYGKRQRRVPQVVVGLILLIYPYFITGVLAMLGVAAALLVLLWLALKQGM